jgi:hypothetical protein
MIKILSQRRASLGAVIKVVYQSKTGSDRLSVDDVYCL